MTGGAVTAQPHIDPDAFATIIKYLNPTHPQIQ